MSGTSEAQAAAADEMVGNWVIENSAENTELDGVQSLTINPDGSAVKKYKSFSVAKRWSISRGKFVVVDVAGVTPGPPEEYAFSFVDSAKKNLVLRALNSYSSKEIKLSKR